ncbi:MAG: CRISPR-associated helicase Cas3' [bacterium]
MNSAPTWPWGKLQRDKSGRLVHWQSLRDHSLDVAAVFYALLKLPGIRKRLAALAGEPRLADRTLERLAYLVFLHDFGKVNVGFQARVDKKAPMVGHIAPIAAVCGRVSDPAVSERALAALGADHLETWVQGIIELFDAILSHHGRPWPRDGDGRLFARHWRSLPDYDPIEALAALRTAANAAFPGALAQGGPLLPASPPFVHAVAGLVQLADWIGSSGWTRDRTSETAEEWSTRTLCDIGLDPAPLRNALRSNVTFEDVFGSAPYAHQAFCGEGSARLMILESETGSGKTEAALWRFLRLFDAGAVDGMYFALPTRTAAAQLHARVQKTVKRLWGADAPPTVMAVPGYLDDQSPGGMPPAEDPLDGPEGDTRTNRTWATEHPKRFFSAMIGVGTIDQALLAALRVKHAHLRASCLMRHLLVVDEVHASDPYMQRLLEQLLRDHLAAGGYAMLLSATLGAEARQSIMEAAMGGRPRDRAPVPLEVAAKVAYPLISTDRHQQRAVQPALECRVKVVSMCAEPLLDDPAGIAALALEAAEAGAKVLVVRNTVSGAVAVQRALEATEFRGRSPLFTVAGTATLHHGRFAKEDRRLLDVAVERSIGRDRPHGGVIVVGTQTLEQSLDIDADVLITDLCPVDVLLQRIGRLHRHVADKHDVPRQRPSAFENPSCVVLLPSDGLTAFLPARRKGGGERHGLGHSQVQGVLRGVYADVTILEATRRLVVEHPVWTIPSMNRWLVESGIHSEALDALVASMPEVERDPWEKNRQRVEGDELAQVGAASSSVLRKDRDFMEQGLEQGEHITTRLGADDRVLTLPANTIGPFGVEITRLTVPGWMVRGVDVEATIAVALTAQPGELAFTYGDRRFVYGAHGLHPMTTTP